MATIQRSAKLPALESQVEQLGWTPESGHYRAYANVLQAEERVLQSLSQITNVKLPKERAKEAKGKLVSVRVAGYLLLEFAAQSSYFGCAPSAALVEWFISPRVSSGSNQDDVIIENGTLLRDNFVRSFRTSNVRYPPPSSHPSRPSFDTLEDMIQDSMEPTGHSYSTSRKHVLARDGYRCVITGIYDRSSRDRCAELRDLRGVTSVSLEMAHIFNDSTMQNINIDPAVDRDSENVRAYNKTYHAASALTILKLFGFSKLVDAFTEPGGVHEAWNLITFEYDLRTFFDRLDMWLEYTDTPHRYKVCTAREDDKQAIHQFAGHDRQDYGADKFVEFSSKLKGVLPPDPFLLALHSTCARVAHTSGAAQFFDQVEWDTEETRVLASDGSSCLLDHLLTPFAVIPERLGAYELVYE